MLEKGKPLEQNNGMTRRGGDDSTNSINSTGAGAFFRLPEKTSIPSLLSSCLSYFKAEQKAPLIRASMESSKHGHTSLFLPSLVAGLAFRAGEARLFGYQTRKRL